VRVLDKSSIKALLRARFAHEEKRLADIPDPALLKDAPKAAKRVARAIFSGERIAVVGDYDVDGVVSTAIMVDFFKCIGYPLQAVIPNRFSDGYGVSPSVLERIDADVVISVDNGITAREAAEVCKERGCDLIITDHHTPPKVLPDAYAIIDPKQEDCSYPFKEICGAEVAWLFLALLKRELQADVDMRSFIDILSIAIIADIMPLVDINRTLVREGLRQIMRSTRPACVIIRDFLNKSRITSEDIAFQIAPRLNSAGRLEDASIALDFLCAESTYKAYEMFEKLSSLNEFRKETEAEAVAQALELVGESDEDIIVVAKEGWHEGVVGIVASRLVDRLGKPAVVLSIDGEEAKGSARSLGEVDIFALIDANREFLEKFGGHKMAAGVSLKRENISAFKEALNVSASKLPRSAFIPKDEIMGILPAEVIDFELLELLESFEPYGEANIRPKFLAKDAKVVSVQRFGSDRSHSRVTLQLQPGDTRTHDFTIFRRVIDPKEHSHLTCSYTISKNEYNNRVSIQLLVSKIYDEEESDVHACRG